ncbi:MAG: inverse autotransporter beta domain-containing protein, partial [Candidatus Omnitrophica bacterium]|nr:inverse autotransporter beta domain-containing protein [Candidatus Omnitrophota bacterium]
HTFFTHDRISIQDERGTYSLGLGYRRLLFEENLLAGINTFFDFQDLHKHYRTGLGLEAITKYLEGRINSYFALSPKRLVEEDSVSKTYEKAVNGGDIELGGPIPYLPWFKVFGSYYRYDYRKFKDKQGWKLRSELKPFKFITLNLETYDDNKGKREYLMDTRFNLVFDSLTPKSILSAFGWNKEPFVEVDLKERTLDRVERNFNIEVEKWREAGGAVFEVGGRW